MSPENPPLRILTTDPRSAAVRSLLEASDQYMAMLYPPESNHLETAEALSRPQVHFLGAYWDNRLVGCGAVKLMEDLEDRYGEIKRLFILADYRGRGISKAIMVELERHLISSKLTLARLETGIHQPEALGLYRRLGYQTRGPFGRYRFDPLSLFMEKSLN